MIFQYLKENVFRRIALWVQICCALILAMAIVGYATTQFGHDQHAKEIGDLLKAESFRTLEMFSAGAIEAVISEDIALLNTLVSETTQLEPNLFSLSVENSIGKPLVRWKKSQDPAPERAYRFERAIAFEGDVFGNIRTVWDPTRLEAEVRQQLAGERARMLFALMALTTLSILLVNFLVSVPLAKIEKRIRLLSDTRQAPLSITPLSLPSSRELSVLSTAVNDLQGAIDASRKLSDELERQANHDHLTGIKNRLAFERSLKKRLDSRGVDSADDMLLFLDLDQFKVVNDTCGHAAGDMLLKQLTTMLRNNLNTNGTIARLGGDEFAVLVKNTSLEDGLALAERLRACIEGFRFTWNDRSFSSGASIGAVAIRGVGNNIEELMSAADIACFAAKTAGRNRVHAYEHNDAELNERQSEMDWVPRIRSAIENDDFVLYGQVIEPTSSLNQNTGHIEILVRMQDGDELVPPGAFLPAAERYDVISPIDRWVVMHTLQWMESQSLLLGSSPRCAINLSGASIGNAQFHEFMLQTLQESTVPGHCISFEITETAAVANLNNAIEFMRVIKQFDCQFALDDFGAGMSSFSYLKNLPVDFVKIDGLFVRDLLDDEVSLAMVKAIAEVSAVMKIQTIAEFVESDAIRHKLEELGIDYVQGYGVGKPKPLSEFETASGHKPRAA